MTRFAFIIHPLSVADVARKLPIATYIPQALLNRVLDSKKVKKVSDIKGIVSKTGATTEGIFVGLPMTPEMFIHGDPKRTMDRLAECVKVAEDEGCQIIGLGAFTSVVGDGGIELAKRSNISITTGNSYTVATAIEGTLEACRMLDVDLATATLGVVGATGSIGRTCAEVLAPRFGSTVVIGRDMDRISVVADSLPRATATTDVNELLKADVVITVTSSETEIIRPEHLKRGAIVCDVARPRDVSLKVKAQRPDVLVIEGGVVSVPGDVDFGFDFGFPAKTAYACMSETMMLALEDNLTNFTLGKTVSVEQVNQTWRWAEKHGFELAGFRSFEREIDAETLARVKREHRVAVTP